MKEISEVETNSCGIEDEYDGLCDMETVDFEKYLGDIISNDGKNSKKLCMSCPKLYLRPT